MNPKHNPQNTLHKSIARHIIFLIAALIILAGLYFYFQNIASVTLGSVVLILAHLAIVTGVVYLLRGFLINAIKKMHAPPAEHSHSHESLETEGQTISWASVYDVLVKTILFGGEKRLREAIIDLAQIRSGEKVLDVGCGTGTLAITAKMKSGPTVKVYGADAAPQMIEKAREKAAKANVDVDFQPGLVEAINFPDNSLDVVLSSFMVHHLPGELKQKAFAEIYRVLKPGGRLLVVDFEPPKGRVLLTVLKMLLGPGMMKIDNRKVPPLLEAAGFVSLKQGNAGHKLATYISGQKVG